MADEEAEARAELIAAQLQAARADRSIRLQEFDGDKPPFRDWCQHVNMCLAAAGWTQEVTAQKAALMLKGKAAIWLQNQMAKETEGLLTWFPPVVEGVRPPNLFTLMENRFHTTVTPIELSQLRATLVMKDNEDVETFFDRVERVQFELDKHLPTHFRTTQKAAYGIVHDQQVFSNFHSGLRPDIRSHVTTVNALTIGEARAAAIAYEQGSKARKPKQGSVFSMGQQQAPTLELLASQIAALSTSIRGGQGGRGRGGKGGAQRQRASTSADDDSVDYCLYCGYIGHQRPKCNIKKKDEAAGIFLPQSQYFSPGRVGKGSERGKGKKGQQSGRGKVHEMGAGVTQQPPLSTQMTQDPNNPQQLSTTQPSNPEAYGAWAMEAYRRTATGNMSNPAVHYPPFQGN
jgi:hypothetical protein